MLVKFPLFVSFQTCWKAAWEQNFESLVSQKACSLTLCIQACTGQSMQRPVKAFALLGNPSLLLRTKCQFSTQSAAHFFKFQQFVYIFLSSHFQHAKHFVAVFRRTYSLVTAGSERVKIQLNNLEYINNLNSEYIHSDEGLGLKTSALKLSTVVNLHCQLGCNIKFRSNKIRAWRVHSRKVGNQYTGTFYFIFMCSLIPFILESRILIKFNEAFFTCET